MSKGDQRGAPVGENDLEALAEMIPKSPVMM